jgi:integrase
VVRRWHSDALRGPGGNTSIGQAYRLVRAVMNTALREGIIARNPARFPGRGVTDKTPNRRNTAASGGTGRGDTWSLKAAVLLAAWGGLRRGEILALRREDVDLKAGVVSVNRNQAEMLEGRRRFDSRPKTDAGYRTVALPPHVLPTLREHLEKYAGPVRLFVSMSAGPMAGDTLTQAFSRTRDRLGMEGFRFHDLRHTGQTLAAATGATLADLMKRLGHSSPAAAMRYLPTVGGRDEAIAEALSVLAEHGDATKLPRDVTTR